MTDRDQLIEEAAKAIDSWLFVYDSNPHTPRIPLAKSIWAVFEKALGEATVTPTDDEREAGWSHPDAVYSPEVFAAIQGLLNDAKGSPMHALRLAVSRQMSQMQGEPSDAELAEIALTFDVDSESGPGTPLDIFIQGYRAALRAAGGVR